MIKPGAFRNILIVRTDRMGDVVLTTPAIKALRQAFPAARLTVLVTPATFDLVNGNPYLDEILVDSRNADHQGPGGFLRLVREIRFKKFDLAVIFHTKRRYNLACCMAGIPNRLGYKNNKFGFLLTMPLKDIRPLGDKHEAQYCLEVLKAVGVEPTDADAFVPLQKGAEEWVFRWMEENGAAANGFIALHPGASDSTKCWPADRFAALIERLLERYPLKIVLIGSPQTMPAADAILRLTNKTSQILNLTGEISLAQMVSLLRRSRLLVSNDSGPVHVAAAGGTHVISLFLRNQPGINAQRWKPLGPKGHILCNKPGEEVLLDNKGRPASGDAGSIQVEDVLQLIEEIFKKDSQYEIF